MKGVWQAKSFEECIEKVTYTTKIQRKDFLAEGAYPIVSQEDAFINGYWDDEGVLFEVTTPVVIFGDHTKVLKYVDFDFVLGADGVKLLQPREFLVPKFFFYQLQTANLDSLGYARHYRLLKELTVVYPIRTEQERIVGVLDEAFAGIAAAKANAEKNLQNAQDLLWILTRNTFVEIESKWGVRFLGDVCEFENGDRGKNYPGKQHRVSDGVPFINAGYLTENGIDFNGMDYISNERFNLLGNGKIRPDDILFCLRGSLGKFSSVRSLAQGAIASSLVILRATPNLDSEYLLAFLSSEHCAVQIESLKGGAAQPNLGAKDLKRFVIPMPPMDIQKQVASRVVSMQSLKRDLEDIYERKFDALDALKQSLLHQAFSGQL